MSPLAQLMRARGHHVQGSDRSFDQGECLEVAAALRQLGIEITPHDGSAVTREIDRFVYSTAVEPDAPEMRAARARGLTLVPRPALLARVVNQAQPGMAIAGTSGKSTIAGLVAWLVRETRQRATVLGGAPLAGEVGSGVCVVGPPEGPVVAEACESDGSLGGYRPALGLIHNISRDHGELVALRVQFTTFGAHARQLLVHAGCPEAAAVGRALGALSYGAGPEADLRLEILTVGPETSRGVLHLPTGPLILELPQPGLHTLENAAAAALLAVRLGVEPAAIEALLPRFPGVARRFELVGRTATGIRVVDDYAHNAAKLRAALTTAQAGAARVLAVFQPHGFGPARFLRAELRELLPRLLRPQDRFCYAEIFYAGGTVRQDISSRMLAEDLPATCRAAYARDHAAVVEWVLSEARPGDTVLIMGARDPALRRLARAVLEALEHAAVPALSR
jgi:UDP-N-acetylmuramate--alanine ligase